MEEYTRAVEEEKFLREALQLCTESGRERHLRLTKETNELAARRLEAALFDNHDDGDDTDESERDYEDAGGGIESMAGL